MGYYFSKFVFWITGWKVAGEIPQGVKKAVMIAAPHTSNWDFLWARLAFFILRVPVRFTVKKELLKFPLNLILNPLGAIGIDRTKNQISNKKQSMTEAMINLFDKRDRLIILVTPEGTRSYVTEWKTGFYRVAEGANVPILCGFLNYEHKIAGIGPMFTVNGQMEQQIEDIKDFYRPIKGKYPEKGVR
ncbi:1-acyl-sn-glycerol-3-phosphate acyltransferase [Marivirga sp. S37H4]|uniref:1-acyl-sn-glycerol-3-phosphate acyltransferase n=1 Tax=Marivirga aurantiaca TaxID=2802615 RepID=A0A934WWN8_9BACT|nr:1-acyl-sn-glycerol-3-phosphate acyltransferase [Marivirga aurantiaca]MBK6264306.1 1-acyl-sn-glycerol-3-phosphate acyltransferase [Marivirga aurantiaca]